jgi:peptidoglycan biosynthesis protein MviN/MurJ (putative lipid II flippase)
MTASSAATQRQPLVRNAAVVGASYAVALALGVIRNAIIARQFGIGAAPDALRGFKLPDLFTIVAGGAQPPRHPDLRRLESSGDREGAWRLTSAVTNWVVLITAALTPGQRLPRRG